MSLNIEQIADAFCSHRCGEIFPYTADEVKWNIIGREELIGREAVVDHYNKSAKFLETVSTTLAKPKIYRKVPHNLKIRKIRPQTWPAAMSFNLWMADWSRYIIRH